MREKFYYFCIHMPDYGFISEKVRAKNRKEGGKKDHNI